ncbi:hypothetical protein Pan216_18330 [Planctomycetes bacterium Pan216]|uniref:Uncharacterized protein n=1 Tax=Kolteria novifilia TaxID=2527975 RepID=A0A518B1X0_9BACT|nr:hypothetical protein Pan216_18330 [Planctomycetes bacterium Pan216]
MEAEKAVGVRERSDIGCSHFSQKRTPIESLESSLVRFRYDLRIHVRGPAMVVAKGLDSESMPLTFSDGIDRGI